MSWWKIFLVTITIGLITTVIVGGILGIVAIFKFVLGII